MTNICNMDSTGSDSRPQYGVIRSHKHFPRGRPKSRLQCETIVPLRMRDSMVIDVFGDSVYTMLNVYVISRTNRAETRLKTKDVVHLHGNTTAAIKITADFRWKRRHIKGFMMSYSSTYIVYSICNIVFYRVSIISSLNVSYYYVFGQNIVTNLLITMQTLSRLPPFFI